MASIAIMFRVFSTIRFSFNDAVIPMDLEGHIAFCIEAMKGIAKDLRLDGNEATIS